MQNALRENGARAEPIWRPSHGTAPLARRGLRPNPMVLDAYFALKTGLETVIDPAGCAGAS